MKLHCHALAVCLILLSPQLGFAAAPLAGETVNPDLASSSSAALPDAPDAAAIEAARLGRQPIGFGRNTKLRLRTEAFSTWAVGTTVGLGGVGFQIATPLRTKMNLRFGANAFNYSPTIVESGIPIDGAIRLRSANASVDIYPYRGSFHISPGITLYNGSRMTATTHIAGGQHFSINDVDYQSDFTDPVHGWFDVRMGSKFAPSFTFGWGNMLKRSTNWTLQTDFGIQYVGTPKFTLLMSGSVCTPADGCTRIQDDPETMANLAQQQRDVNEAIQPLRFYPILTTSIGYRFGHKTSTQFWR